MVMERMKLNKKGLFKEGLFAIVAISVLVMAFATIIDQQAERYGTTVISEVGGLNKLDEVSGTAEVYESSLTPEDPEPGEDAETGTFRGVYGMITGYFGAVDIVTGDGGMIESVTTQTGTPVYVRQAVITLFFIAIAMGLVAVIFRLSRSSA